MRLRVCRSLLWLQAAYTFFAGVFVLLAAVVLGGSSSIPFVSGAVSGGGAGVLAVAYIVAAGALVVVAAALTRAPTWARPGTLILEALLTVLQLLRQFDLSVSTVIGAGLIVAILALLFLPGAHSDRNPARG